MRRIAFVLLQSIEPFRGGLHEVLRIFRRELRKLGWEASIVPYRYSEVNIHPPEASHVNRRNVYMRQFFSKYLNFNRLAVQALLSFAFLRRVVADTKNVNAIIAETCWTVIPSAIASFVNKAPLLMHLHSIESERQFGHTFLDRSMALIFERLGLAFSEKVFVVSQRDKRTLTRKFGSSRKIEVLHIIVDLQEYSSLSTSKREALRARLSPNGLPLVAFVGGMGYPPNRDAALIIRHEIMPRVNRGIPRAIFLLIGPDAPPAALHPYVIASGYVHRVAEYIASSDACIAPVRFGGGVKLKVLDYFAAGKPVVSTSIGIEGLSIEIGQECLVADDYETFASCIVRLIEDRDLAHKLGVNAKRYLLSRYSPEQVTSVLVGAITNPRTTGSNSSS